MIRAALLVTLVGTVAHADPCIPDFRSAERLVLDGSAVKFCDDQAPKKQQCFAVDLATGKATSIARFDPPAPPSKGSTLEIAGKTAKACTADGACKTLRPKARVDDGLGMHGEVGTKLAVLINLSRIETFDVKTGKRIAGFDSGKGMCASVSIVADDVLLVQNRECGTDGGAAFFATPKGKRLAAVPIAVTAPVVLDGSVSFVAAQGDELVVQDSKTGKLARRIPLGKPHAETSPQLVGDARRVVVVYGGERAGDIAVVDLATDKVTAFAAQRCP